MKIKEVLGYLEELAPGQLQESYDNSGLLVGDANAKLSGILVSLDCIESVVDEAIANNCNLVVSHHPIVFSGLKRFTGRNYIERTIMKAIKNDIALYAIHTNLDNVAHGVNDVICDKLQLQNRKILSPKKDLLEKLVVYTPKTHVSQVRDALFSAGAGRIGEYSECSFETVGQGSFKPSSNANPAIGTKNVREVVEEVKTEVIVQTWQRTNVLSAMKMAHPYEEVAYEIYPTKNSHPSIGSGMIGDLDHPMDALAFAKWVKEAMEAEAIKHTAVVKEKVSKVAVCGGSGSFLLEDAVRNGADVFITSDFKYHQYFDADGRIMILDIGHYESEHFTSDYLQVKLKEKFANFAVRLSEIKTNPINFI